MGIITIIIVLTLLTLEVIIRINDAGHIFGFLFASHVSSLEKGLFTSFAHYKTGLSSFIKFLEFFTYSRYKSFTRYMLCKNFSRTVLDISFS